MKWIQAHEIDTSTRNGYKHMIWIQAHEWIQGHEMDTTTHEMDTRT